MLPYRLEALKQIFSELLEIVRVGTIKDLNIGYEFT